MLEKTIEAIKALDEEAMAAAQAHQERLALPAGQPWPASRIGSKDGGHDRPTETTGTAVGGHHHGRGSRCCGPRA